MYFTYSQIGSIQVGYDFVLINIDDKYKIFTVYN